ncbi:restriction endonuclease subunit S [Aeromonas sp. FDAARGOS 1411]|uniref:restriction endonuclease subunit S n=1 Tax=Aeromonas TaxID=642 RepID=UPI001C23690F|nr:restriction endonuclease subunit S [Aeromonas sp. FDAARGOS 1411]QWZ93987.1 restriction endonuclease subunit S [Aeromonas sp. FDAARGOS 1411]
MVPNAWSIKPVANILEKVSNPVNVNPEMVYHEIGIRSHGKGIFYKEPIFGKELGNKRVFYVEPDCLVVNIVFAWEQAIAKTTINEKGKIASHRFPMFKPRGNLCDIDYILYLFKSRKGKYLLELASPGGAGRNKTLGQSEFSKLELILPPIEEQKKIAKILSTWDKAISTTEQLLANSQQQKKALMQQLLTGKKRLLDSNGVRFSGEWVHGRLGELCTFKGGSAFKEEYQGHSEGDLPFIKVSDMNLRGNEKYIDYANNWLTNQAAKELKAKAFPKNTIVFAKVGAALLLNRRRILLRPTIIDNNMMAAIPTKFGDTEFIYQLMLAVDFAKFVQEGAVPSVNQGDLASFKISYPEKEEQQKIAAVLSTAEQEITALQQKLDTLKQEKKALMQQLLTGKRRVKVEEAA